MSNLSFAVHVGVSVRSVAGWHQKPGTVMAQGTQELLDDALERASERAKAQFTMLANEASSHEGGAGSVPLLTSDRVLSPAPGMMSGRQPGQEPVPSTAGHDAGGLADGPGWLDDLDRSVSLVDGLAVADLADGPVAGSEWTPAAVPGLITGFLFSGQAWMGGQGPSGLVVPAVSDGDVSAGRIRAFTRSLMDLDFQYGGGHVRRMLLFYFRSEIVPLLRGRHPDRVRRELFSAAAEVAQLLGWSAYDAGRHGTAQRYFAQGLRLAGEAGDPALGAWVMSSLSHQANYLGQYQDALQLARAAQSAAAGRATAAVRSVLLAMEARALASLGDRAGCAGVLHRAERELDQRMPAAEPEWIYYFDELELSGEAAHCARDLGQAKDTRELAASALDPVATPPRTAAFISLVDAAGALRSGDLDEALVLASGAVELAGPLQSARYLRYVSDFHSALVGGRHAAHPSVRQFTGLVSAAHPGLLLEGAPIPRGDLAAQRSDPGRHLVGNVA
jgi:hypothetical protein